MYDSLIRLNTIEEYRQYYIREYCKKEIYSHDGIRVKFRPERFEHAFFKSADRKEGDKSIFSQERAERIGWIKKVLQDKNLPMYAGWDTKRKRYDHSRRICIVTPDNYVVVIRMVAPEEAVFVTAYPVDNPDVTGVAAKIKASPIWSGSPLPQ